MNDAMHASGQPVSTDANKRYVRKYLGVLSAFTIVLIAALFVTFHLKSSQSVRERLYWQGKELFTEIVIVRAWVAKHGGVYVPIENSGGVNPYLNGIEGVQAVMECGGKTFTLKNPALVTRELSAAPGREGRVSYRITSLKPLNPGNAPDAFEAESLAGFERGAKEATAMEERDGRTYFRYMAPLMTTEACLHCHARQGYSVGDVRGGIDVSILADDALADLRRGQGYMALAGLGVIALVILSTLHVSGFFIRDLQSAQDALARMATTDYLTELPNRLCGIRALQQEMSRMSRYATPLSIALVDLDYFKKVNDVHGHGVGDEVLVTFASRFRKNVRGYDTPCRYGGEEFLLVMPDTDLEAGRIVVERLLEGVRSEPFATSRGDIVQTCSAGVVQMRPGESLETALERADMLLHWAKQGGRDRVCG